MIFKITEREKCMILSLYNDLIKIIYNFSIPVRKIKATQIEVSKTQTVQNTYI